MALSPIILDVSHSPWAGGKPSHGFARIFPDTSLGLSTSKSGFIRMNPRRSGAKKPVLIRGCFECSRGAPHRPQKGGALRFKSFQVGSHGVVIPAENRADAQRGFAAARLR